MKTLSVLFFLLTFVSATSQTINATTDDGKKVVLSKDFTWKYVQGNKSSKTACTVADDFKEPKWNTSKAWKRMGTRVDDLKKHISVDLSVDENKIVLLQLSEQLGNAVYVLCIDGVKMKYRRTGSVFRKDGEDVLKMD